MGEEIKATQADRMAGGKDHTARQCPLCKSNAVMWDGADDCSKPGCPVDTPTPGAVEAMREACAKVAYPGPQYMGGNETDEHGQLPPGSPYDRGRYDAAKAIRSLPLPGAVEGEKAIPQGARVLSEFLDEFEDGLSTDTPPQGGDIEAGADEATLQEVYERLLEGTFYEDHDWASGPALRAVCSALAALTAQPLLREVVDAAHELLTYADLMPKKTPAAGSCVTEHNFTIEGGTIWGLDIRAEKLRTLLGRIGGL